MKIQINSFMAVRLDRMVDGATKELTDGAEKEFQKAADKVAQEWSDAIPAGRGGSRSAQMKDISAIVTQPKRGGFFVRMGWLNGPPMAEDGKQTWFIYHDTGYHAFGKTWVPGIGVYLSMRSKVLDEMDNAADRVARRVEKVVGGV